MTYVHENKIVTSEKDSPNFERLLYYFLPPFFFLPLAVRVMFYWIAANSISLDGRRAIALLTLPSSFFHIVNNFLRLSTTPSLKYHSYLHFDRIFNPILIYRIWSMHFVCTFFYLHNLSSQCFRLDYVWIAAVAGNGVFIYLIAIIDRKWVEKINYTPVC